MGKWFQNVLTTEFDHPGWDFIWHCCLVDIEFGEFIINYTFITFAKLKARIWLDFRGNFTKKAKLPERDLYNVDTIRHLIRRS